MAATLALLASPTRLYADGFVSPWVGVNFAHDPGDGRGSFGVTAGGMGAGIIGGEFDLGYSPSFFGSSADFGNNNVLNVMGNLIVGIPIGGTHGAGFRPYVTGGLGLIRSVVEGTVGSLDITDTRNNDMGYDLGAGVMGFFNNHVGVRGDLRYFRAFNDNATSLDPLTFQLGSFHFWRGSFGLVLR